VAATFSAQEDNLSNKQLYTTRGFVYSAFIATRIANRLNLDFALGIGYLHSNYKTYVPRDGCYVYQETKKQKWLGPTQAEISLVWLLGKGNTNKKKGGKK